MGLAAFSSICCCFFIFDWQIYSFCVARICPFKQRNPPGAANNEHIDLSQSCAANPKTIQVEHKPEHDRTPEITFPVA
jgi:hypothetical protein